MNPATHFLASWSIANSCELNKRERIIITLSGISPDIDGLGLLVDLFGKDKGQHLTWWDKYHHILGHNIGFGIFLVLVAFTLSTKRWLVSFLVFVCFHVHLVCDLIGARGPDGYQWPIPYLLPFSNAWQWTWAGQWPLNAWPNFVITAALLAHMFYLTWSREISPLEIISPRANALLVNTLRQRFGIPNDKTA